MLRRSFMRALTGVAAAIAVALPVQVLSVTPAAAAPRILYYDPSGAGEFVNVVVQGANNWNARVTNVRLDRWTSGHPRNIVVTVDNAWPRTQLTSLGNGRIIMGRQAVQQGYFPPRITTHEFGHILGLPDRRTGLCADLMSGSSAPVSCTNQFPNATEAAQVNSRFATSFAPATSERELVFVD